MYFKSNDQANVERLQLMKFLLIGFIILGLFTGLKGCTDKLPSWLVGESKQTLAVKSEVLSQQLDQAYEVIRSNEEDAKRAIEAKAVTEHVLQEVKVSAKKIEEKTQAKKKIYQQTVDKVKADTTLTEEQKTSTTLDVSIDAVWDAYEDYIGNHHE